MLKADDLARDLIEKRLAKQQLTHKVWMQLTDAEMQAVKDVAAILKLSEAQTRRAIFLRGLMETEKPPSV